MKVVFVVDSRKTDLPIIYTASHFDYGFERVYIPPEPGLKGFYDKIRQDIRSFAENCLLLCTQEKFCPQYARHGLVDERDGDSPADHVFRECFVPFDLGQLDVDPRLERLAPRRP